MWLFVVTPRTGLLVTWATSIIDHCINKTDIKSGDTCPNEYSKPINQYIRTQYAQSWKKLYQSVSRWLQCHWTSAVASALSKLYMCTQNISHTEIICLIWFRTWDGGLIKQAQLEQTNDTFVTAIKQKHIYKHERNGWNNKEKACSAKKSGAALVGPAGPPTTALWFLSLWIGKSEKVHLAHLS